MIDAQTIANHIITVLIGLKERPFLYLGQLHRQSFLGVDSFLSGLNMIAHVIDPGIGHADNSYRAVVRERGWDDGTTKGAVHLMFDRGMSEAAIIEELIDIELEAWKRRYALFAAESPMDGDT
jgi:hypothetical protein